MKRLARHAVAALAVGTRLWPVVRPGRVAVLRYHRVAGTAAEPVPLAVPREEFAAQLRFLRARCHVVRPSEAAAAATGAGRPLPRNAVAITFDDGYADNASTALPLLQEHGLPAAFFVTAGWIGTTRTPWWDRLHEVVRALAERGGPPLVARELAPLLDPAAAAGVEPAAPGGLAALESGLVRTLRDHAAGPEDCERRVQALAEAYGLQDIHGAAYRPMTWDQVRALGAAGMEVGSHLMTHVRLDAVGEERARAELGQSKRRIEEHLGEPVVLLAYPAGRCGGAVRRWAAEAGYRAGFTTATGAAGQGHDPLRLPRIGVWGGGYAGAWGRFSPSVFGLQVGRLARRRTGGIRPVPVL